MKYQTGISPSSVMKTRIIADFGEMAISFYGALCLNCRIDTTSRSTIAVLELTVETFVLGD